MRTSRIPFLAEGFSFLLLVAGFATIQALIGGTRSIFALPAYVLIALIGLLALFSIRSAKPVPNQLCLLATAVLFAYILGRAALSPVPYIARSDLYSVLAGLVVYFFVACIMTGSRARIFFLALLLALAIAHVFVGALQFRDGTNFMPISWLQRYDYGARASGFYICPNHLAGLLEVLGVMGLSLVCWSRWPVWGKMLVGYAVGLCYLGVVLTGSRGGYLSAGASLIVFAGLSIATLRRTSRRLFWSIGGAGAVAAVLIGMVVIVGVQKSHFLTSRAQTVVDPGNMRIDLWQAAIEQWKLNPLFGTGSATYLYYGREFRTERVQRDPIYVHNDYLQLLAEYGILGAAGMALFLGVHLWRGGGSFLRLGPKRVAVSPRVLSNALALNLGAIAAVASYLVHSVVDFNLHIPANLLLMAFVFGLLANDGVVREAEAVTAAPRVFVWRLALPVLGAILLFQSIRLLPGEYFAEHSRTALRDQQAGASIRYALQGLNYDRKNPDLYYYLGLARSTAGQNMEDARAAASFYNRAVLDFEQAHALAPRDEIYLVEIAFALDAAGRFDEAEWRYYQAIQLDPKSDNLQRYYQRHLEQWRKSALPPEAPAEG